MEPFGDAPGANSGPAPPPLQKLVGLENVHSKTVQGQVPVPHLSEEKIVTVPAKEGSTLRLSSGQDGSDAQVGSETDGWMQADQAPAGNQQPEEPQKEDMKIKTQLVHVGVKEFSSRGKDRHFGYIITGSEWVGSRLVLFIQRRLERSNILMWLLLWYGTKEIKTNYWMIEFVNPQLQNHLYLDGVHVLFLYK